MPAKSHIRRELFLFPVLITACTLSLLGTPTPVPSPSPSPTALAFVTTSAPTATPTDAQIPTIMPTSPKSFCDDSQPRVLIQQFETAMRSSDGDLLASLVSPEHGMDARLFRDGRIVNYDREHAAALFESAFSLNWGNAPGSGLETVGSFKELLLPDLLDVLTRDYETACNQVLVGGTTYTATWPYQGIDFFALHFPGTPTYGGMDWHTWLVGMHYVGGKPYLYAIMQFKWES